MAGKFKNKTKNRSIPKIEAFHKKNQFSQKIWQNFSVQATLHNLTHPFISGGEREKAIAAITQEDNTLLCVCM